MSLVSLPGARAEQPGASRVADDRSDEYREAFIRGRWLFERARWDEARAAFERAYEVHPTPLLLFNIGSTHRRQGDRRRAIEYYERYLDEAEEGAELRSLAEQTIAELREALAAEERPAPRPDPVQPRSIRRADDGGDDPGRTWKIAGAGLAVLGVGALGWGTVEGFRARSAASELDSLEPGTPWTAGQQQTWEEGEAAERRAMIFAAAGGAALVTGAVLYWVGDRREPAASRAVTVVPTGGASFAGLQVSGAF